MSHPVPGQEYDNEEQKPEPDDETLEDKARTDAYIEQADEEIGEPPAGTGHAPVIEEEPTEEEVQAEDEKEKIEEAFLDNHPLS